MKKDYLVGVDIGSSKISITIGEINELGLLRILGSYLRECSGIKKGIINDAESVKNCIKEILEEVKKSLYIDIENIYLGIPSFLYRVVPSKGIISLEETSKNINQEDIIRVLEVAKIVNMTEEEAIVEVLTEGYYIDDLGPIEDPLNKEGKRFEVEAKIIIGKANLIKIIYDTVIESGLKVKGLKLNSIAAYGALEKNKEKETIAIIDTGVDTTSITVFKNGFPLFNTFIPIGGKTITQDISICSGIIFEDAEKIKIQYGATYKAFNNTNIEVSEGNTIERYTLCDIIEARVEEIFKFIHEELIRSGHYQDIETVYLVGSGISLFKGVKDLSEAILKKSTKLLENTLKHSSFISLGIVKQVYNEVKLECDLHIIENENNNIKDKKENNLITKIKRFFIR